MPPECIMQNHRLSKFRLKLSLMLLGVGGFAFPVMVALGRHGLVLLSFLVAVLGVLLGKNRLVCSQCGKAHLAIGADVACCQHCGAPYYPEIQQDEKTA
jgi:hypothetical protein